MNLLTQYDSRGTIIPPLCRGGINFLGFITITIISIILTITFLGLIKTINKRILKITIPSLLKKFGLFFLVLLVFIIFGYTVRYLLLLEARYMWLPDFMRVYCV